MVSTSHIRIESCIANSTALAMTPGGVEEVEVARLVSVDGRGNPAAGVATGKIWSLLSKHQFG